MKKNKNRLEIRLDPESLELLTSLLTRTNLTKTSLIKNALKVYASTLKNGHIYTVRYKSEKITDEEKPHVEEIEQDDEKIEDNWKTLVEESEKMKI